MKSIRNMIDKLHARQEELANKEDGFSLLELVVAVSIMLILAVVGFIAYQGLTDNARDAAVSSAANQVLTAAIAADNSPDGDDSISDVVATYNSQYDEGEGITVTYEADETELEVTATDENGHFKSVSAPGNYAGE